MNAPLPETAPAVSTFPGPRTWHPLGFFGPLAKEPLAFLERLAAEHGDYVCFRMLHERLFLVNEPAGIHHILADNSRNYEKSKSYDKLRPLLGEGLLTSEGALWRQQRRLIQPEFTRQRLASFVPRMVAITERLLQRWHELAVAGTAFDMAAEMTRLTLAIVGDALFETDISGVEADSIGAAVQVLLADADARLSSLVNLPAWLPTPQNRRVRAAKRRIDALVGQMIATRRQGGGAGDDLLGRMLAAQDDAAQGMSAAQLRDEVLTLVMAGHETTALALCWCFYLLAQHPQVLERLRAELDGQLGSRDPRAEDFASLSYTRQVFEETMRLYPPLWIVERRALEEDRVGGLTIPAGGWVLISSWLTHRHPGLWDEPEQFRPERFARDVSRQRPRYAYYPFGGGPRLCVGKHFAMIELWVVLSMVLRRFDPVLAEPAPKALRPTISLRPAGGLRMRVRLR